MKTRKRSRRGPLAPRNLRCEYLTDPLAIETTVPRLSWEVADPRRGAVQSACQVLVASSAENLAADKGDLWDTGRAASDQSVHVVFAGRPLASRRRCWWKVRTWDAAGKPSPWSRAAFWGMGLLAPEDWQAEWIGYEPPAVAQAEPDAAVEGGQPALPCPCLRKGFSLARATRVCRATVYATARGVYELRLNGSRVGEDLLTPGWTDYRKRLYYQTYDVTRLVRRGANVLGAMVAPGWYGLRARYGTRFSLLAQLEIEFADGTRQVVATDASWKGTTGAVLAADLYDGESYDARREMPGWDAPAFDDAAWGPVAAADAPQVALQAYPNVPTRRTGELKTVKVTEPTPGAFVFDLGQNFTGWARLKVRGPAGTAVTLRFAEVLEPDGTIHTRNLRSAKCTDTYVLRGGRAEVWEPRFTFHGFRYVEVTGWPGRRPPAGAVTGVAVNSDTPWAGRFECSSALVNRLWLNTTWTQRGNFLDIPTDCPQRDERLGWTGDAQIYVRTAAWNMDVAAFFTKWLVDLQDAQGPDGAFPDVAPRVAAGAGTAAWGDAGAICPWTIHQVYGDTRVLERHYAAMTRWIEYLRTNSRDLLRPAEGYGDWVPAGAETPKDVLATACFAASTRLVAKAARAIGKDDDAKKYEDLFKKIKAAFVRACVAADGKVRGDTQTGYAMALAFDLLPEDRRPAAADRLVRDIEARGDHLSVGFVGVASLLRALNQAGRFDVAYRLLEQETYPSWLYPVTHGATSIWERWNGWTEEHGLFDPAMNSFAHYAFGAVGEWLFSTVAGIDADAPGFKRILIRPRVGGRLAYAGASYRSMYGPITALWRLKGGNLALDVAIPPNATATVYVPAASADAVTEGRRPAARAEGVRFLGMDGGDAVFEVGAGTYRFVSKGADRQAGPRKNRGRAGRG